MFMGVDTLDTLEVDVDTLDSLLETNLKQITIVICLWVTSMKTCMCDS